MHWDNIGYIGYEIQSLQLLQLFSIKAFILILLVAFCDGCADILQLLPRAHFQSNLLLKWKEDC